MWSTLQSHWLLKPCLQIAARAEIPENSHVMSLWKNTLTNHIWLFQPKVSIQIFTNGYLRTENFTTISIASMDTRMGILLYHGHPQRKIHRKHLHPRACQQLNIIFKWILRLGRKYPIPVGGYQWDRKRVVCDFLTSLYMMMMCCLVSCAANSGILGARLGLYTWSVTRWISKPRSRGRGSRCPISRQSGEMRWTRYPWAFTDCEPLQLHFSRGIIIIMVIHFGEQVKPAIYLPCVQGY